MQGPGCWQSRALGAPVQRAIFWVDKAQGALLLPLYPQNFEA